MNMFRVKPRATLSLIFFTFLIQKFEVESGKSAVIIWKICPREFPRANFSRQSLQSFHCLYQTILCQALCTAKWHQILQAQKTAINLSSPGQCTLYTVQDSLVCTLYTVQDSLVCTLYTVQDSVVCRGPRKSPELTKVSACNKGGETYSRKCFKATKNIKEKYIDIVNIKKFGHATMSYKM